ncbi:MAG: DUF58 domain-containing protein [Chloroflexi bacterium]|nr:DUF58 domain-containing protein [Chloroflexota bacterium]
MRTGGLPAVAVLAFVLAAGVSREPVLVVLAASSAAAWIVVELTGRLALRGVEVDARIEPERLVAGEIAVLAISIVNRKPLAMPWLELALELPEGIETEQTRLGVPRTVVTAGFAPRAHERATLRIRLRVAQRGAYRIGSLRLRAGDWLGFTQEERRVELGLPVVAYPAPIVVPDRFRAALRPVAEASARRGLVPDPLRFRGVREHRAGDPKKEIHWKTSARLRTLQTKVYEPASSLDTVFLLNVASYAQFWIQADPEAVETVISATARLARIASGAGRQVGLITNGLDNVTHERPRAALGRGPRPLQRTLEILARLGPYAANSPEAVFLRERGRLSVGATLVVVTPVLPSALAEACVALRRAHHRVLVLSVAPVNDAVIARLHGADVVCEALAAGERARGA